MTTFMLRIQKTISLSPKFSKLNTYVPCLDIVSLLTKHYMKNYTKCL